MTGKRGGACIGVVAGSGGAGATALAAALAGTLTPSVLVDLDPLSGGIDMVLGIEKVHGTRWSGLHSDGGRIDPAELAEALPRWSGVAVLSCDRAELSPAAVGSVLAAAAELGTVVVDLGRQPSPARAAAIERCDLVVLVVRATVPGIAAAIGLTAFLPDTRWCLVLAPGGTLSKRRVAHAVGAASVLAVESDRALADRGGAGIDAAALRRSTRGLARRILALANARALGAAHLAGGAA